MMKVTKPLTTVLITLIVLSCFISLFNVENAAATGLNGTIIFRETGLASGIAWIVKVQTTNYTVTNTQYSISWADGIPCPWTVYVPSGYTSTSTLTGTAYVSTGETKYVDVVFTSAATYSVTFTGEGLEPGASWRVLLNGQTISSTNSNITFSGLAAGTYSYGVTSPANHVLGSPSTGSVTITNSNMTRGLSFYSLSNCNSLMFRHNSVHNSNFTSYNGPTSNFTKWTYQTGGAVQSSPAIVDGVLYVGSDDGHVYSLNASTGQMLWSYQTGAASDVRSSPAVSNGVVYVGADDGKLHAIYANNGSAKWTFNAAAAVRTSPVEVDGIVYFGSDARFYAVNATTGTYIWFKNTGPVKSSPAVLDGIVYFGSNYNYFWALDAATGDIIRRPEVGSPVQSSPAIDQGVAYFGANDNKLYAYNIGTGTTVWSPTLDNNIQSCPVVAGDTVYATTIDGTLYALYTSNGTQKWSKTIGATQSSPIVIGETVYVGSDNNKFYALNAADGEEVWSYTSDAGFKSTPSFSNGVLYVGAENGKIYAFKDAQCTLTMNTVGQGSVLPGNGTQTGGSSVNIVAIPNAGWTFNGWSGDATGATNTTITMDGNKTVTATFVENTYTLTMITVGEGTVNPGNVNTYHYGDTVDIKAINAQGWSFAGWSGDATGATNTTITMDANKTVTAAFTRFSALVNGENSGHVGESITYSGLGYAPNTDYYLTFGGYNIGNIQTNSSGGFTYTSTVMKIMGAEWTVELINALTTLSAASTQFTVLPSLTLNVTSAPSGTNISIVATGLMSGTPTIGDNLTATFNGAIVTLNNRQSSGWGDFNATFTVPLLAPGNYTLRITDNTGDNLTATFRVTGYTITVNQNSHGTISPSTAEYTAGANQTYTITPDVGYHILDVIVDSVSKGAVSSWQFTSIAENHTITATYAPDEYTLTITTIGNGAVIRNPNQTTYHYGDVVGLTATPDAGWSFSAWTGDASGTTTTTSITITGNKTVTATFVENTYTLTMLTVGNGNVNPGNVTTYHYGDSVDIKAINAVGWSFSGWSGDASGAANTTLTMNSNKTVTATFLQNIYTITMTYTGNGHVDFNATQPYSYGQTVSLTPVADPGWSFYGWSGDAQGSTNPLPVSTTVNKTITAVFTQNTYTLTMITVGNGQVLPGNATTYTYGDNVDLKAIASAGWSFNGWTGDATGTSNTTININTNKTVTATFTENTYTLTILTVGNGNISPGNVTNYHYGNTVNLEAMNAYGWTFTGWSGDATGATNTTITMDANKTVTATFTQNVYTLTMITVGNGNVSPGNQTYLSGTNVTISASPAQGWQISSISYGYANNTIITMNGNLTVLVTFMIQSVYVPPITPPTPTTVTLNILPSVGGTTTPANGSHTYNRNVLVQVTATPNPGCSFAYWIVDNNAEGSESTLTLTMASNHTVQAIFVNNTYTLTVITQGQGTVSPANSSYRYGELVSLEAIAASGWSFSGWSGDATGISNTAITMDANKAVTATFTQNTYNLTIITVGSGTVSPANQSCLSGTTVNLQALSSSGWSFSGWSGDASGLSDATLTMDSDKTVYATFTQNTYTLTVLTTGQGTVSPGNQTYMSGSIVDLTATAASGWSFSGWSGDVSAAAATSIVIDSNKVVTATFTRNTYTVSFSASGIAADYSGGVLTVDGVVYNMADLPLSFNWQYGTSHSYQFGSTLDATATKRYVYNAISGLSSTQNGTLTVTQAGTITAAYETQYQLTVQTSQGTANGGGWYSVGSTATASVQTSTVQSTDNTRYVLSGWSGSASGSGTTVSVLMDGAKSVTAEWTKQYYITINANPSGAAASLTSSTWTPAGTITITTSAGGNYNFTSWTTTGDVTIASTSSASTTATVNGAATITANFDQPSQTILATMTTNSETYIVQLGGNITSSQMMNLTITPQPETSSTIVEFTVTGKSGDHGFGNLTLSKDAIPYGTTPVIYIDGVQVANQGYTEDENNYYIWYTMSFSTHTVTIQFTINTNANEPTPAPTASTQPNDDLPTEFNPAFVAVFALVIAFIAVAVLYWRRKQKQ